MGPATGGTSYGVDANAPDREAQHGGLTKQYGVAAEQLHDESNAGGYSSGAPQKVHDRVLGVWSKKIPRFG